MFSIKDFLLCVLDRRQVSERKRQMLSGEWGSRLTSNQDQWCQHSNFNVTYRTCQHEKSYGFAPLSIPGWPASRLLVKSGNPTQIPINLLLFYSTSKQCLSHFFSKMVPTNQLWCYIKHLSTHWKGYGFASLSVLKWFAGQLNYNTCTAFHSQQVDTIFLFFCSSL